MAKAEFFVLTFNSTHHAIHTEKLLKRAGVDAEMIPTPREITASCGLSIKFSTGMLDRVMEVIDAGELDKSIMKLYKGTKYPGCTIYLEE